MYHQGAVSLRVEASKRSLFHKDNAFWTVSSDSNASGLEDCLEQAAKALSRCLCGLAVKFLVDGEVALKPSFNRTLDPKLVPHSWCNLHG